MTDKTLLALLVSSAGTYQNGLLALMTTIPQISVVLVVEDVKSAMRMVENHHPRLIILDIYVLEVQNVIQQIKSQFPHIQLIVIAEDFEQQKKAEVFGVDNVLLKGFSAQKLVEIVEHIFVGQEGISPGQANTQG
jgi:DNA-binding NarL/FixJ family response regulator